jgi:hypothetical protein
LVHRFKLQSLGYVLNTFAQNRTIQYTELPI